MKTLKVCDLSVALWHQLAMDFFFFFNLMYSSSIYAEGLFIIR